MPTLHRIRGCKIQMFAREHGVPHVHLAHEGGKAVVAVESGEVLAGTLPRDAASALDWIGRNRAQLLARWAELQGKLR